MDSAKRGNKADVIAIGEGAGSTGDPAGREVTNVSARKMNSGGGVEITEEEGEGPGLVYALLAERRKKVIAAPKKRRAD